MSNTNRFRWLNANTGEFRDFNTIVELNEFVIAQELNTPYYVIDTFNNTKHFNENGHWLLASNLFEF